MMVDNEQEWTWRDQATSMFIVVLYFAFLGGLFYAWFGMPHFPYFN